MLFVFHSCPLCQLSRPGCGCRCRFVDVLGVSFFVVVFCASVLFSSPILRPCFVVVAAIVVLAVAEGGVEGQDGGVGHERAAEGPVRGHRQLQAAGEAARKAWGWGGGARVRHGFGRRKTEAKRR